MNFFSSPLLSTNTMTTIDQRNTDVVRFRWLKIFLCLKMTTYKYAIEDIERD